jgi:polyhydroxyalkanoate synthase subunit PhaC
MTTQTHTNQLNPAPMSGFAASGAFDHLLHASQAPLTGGVSPAGIANAYTDWLVHMANSPTKISRLAHMAMEDWIRLAVYAATSLSDEETTPPAPPDRRDPRFRDDTWNSWPYNVMAQTFLLSQAWWDEATTHVRGLEKQHEREVEFLARQNLDILAPANFPWLNPEVINRTYQEAGMNLVRGAGNLAEQWRRQMFNEKPKGVENYRVGKDVAITPGKVIYRNRLIELIQYTPQSKTVWAEPVLIVPAWIMKYYILDLSEHDSLVRYLVSRGHTVFMISWKNPSADDRDLGMDDYQQLGVMAALDAIGEIRPKHRVHACGYCLGGTLLAITAAAMARNGDDRLATVTLLAAQTDFTEAGALMLFIDESELAYLEDMMWAQGYLDTKQMSGAFQMLRAPDLIWSRMIHHFLLGEEEPLNDLMAWNADLTRMPYRMHSQYLRRLFLENRLATGHYEFDGQPIALTDITAEIFAVATTRDHIAPWQSVYKIKILSDTDVTFVLAGGGHNAGIVSEPGHAHRNYQIMAMRESERYTDPESWRRQAPLHDGSWWPAWSKWLAKRSTSRVKPPRIGLLGRGRGPIMDAPGSYVLEA